MNKAHPSIRSNTPISAKDLYSYADKNEIFTSFNGMVCAGSTKKIMEFLEFCTEGAYDDPKLSDGDNPSYPIIENFVVYPEKWYAYALTAIEFDCFIELEYLHRQTQKEPTQELSLKNIMDVYEGMRRYCINVLGSPPPEEKTSFAENAAARQNAILKLLERKTIAAIPEKYLHARLDF